MRERRQTVLASVLTFLVGAWILVSPVFISITGAALVSMMVAGGVLALAGLVQIFWENTLPSWTSAVAAAYLFVTAFTFTVSDAVIWNQVVAGFVAFILATWDGIE